MVEGVVFKNPPMKWVSVMKRLRLLENKLEPGTVYRRAELAQWSNSVDRHLSALVD